MLAISKLRNMTPGEFFRKVYTHGVGWMRRTITNPLKYEFSKLVPDKFYIEHRYKRLIGRKPNLDAPVTFNEKLNWIKLHDRRPVYTILADKYEVKRFVKERFEVKTIPTLGIYNTVDEIDFGHLPDPFVIKCTHDSGSTILCNNMDDIKEKAVKKQIKDELKKDWSVYSREWQYKNVNPRVLVEPVLGDGVHLPYDYKVHCFNGNPEFIELIGERNLEEHSGYVGLYDFDWNPLDWSFGDYPPFTEENPCPEELEELYEIARKMAEGFAYVRIDYYIIEHEIFFGEYTFMPSAGFNAYNDVWTVELDECLGRKIKLNI